MGWWGSGRWRGGERGFGLGLEYGGIGALVTLGCLLIVELM